MRCASGWLWLVLSVGCDPTSGLTDTAEAARPSVKRYFDGPGTQLTEGPWHHVVVDLDHDTLYHVGARRLDDEQPTFHLFGTDARQGCAVEPNAATWLMGKPKAAPYRLLPYLESIDERGRGRLRFTTLDCEVQEIAVEDAGRPYSRLYDDGYLVPSQQGYTFVLPWSGESHVIAARLQRILFWNTAVVLWADGKLKSYDEQAQWAPGAEWGEAVVSAIPLLEREFLVEDESGVTFVRFDAEALGFEAEPILPEACKLQRASRLSYDPAGAWVAMELPCGSGTPTLMHFDIHTHELLEQYELPSEVDARYARAFVGGADGPLPQSFLYLTDVDDEGLGTLWAWQTGSEQPILLGERADIDAVFFDRPDSGWDGSAQVNYQSVGGLMAHDWIHFRWDGATEMIAERIVKEASSGDALINFDGVAGDLTHWDDGLSIVARGVPAGSPDARSYTQPPRSARIDQFDGVSGRLLLSDAAEPPSWAPIASGTTPGNPRFAWFMPAIVFIEDWDGETDTGSLVAYNYELDARARIAEGVSSFDLTSYPWDGVIYTVPRGKQRGVWFSKAK